ncbi:9100_t:CDS:2, partial [Racocetra persica]
KSNLFSGLNNVAEYGLLEERFTEYYGFTQEEVDELLVKVPAIINKDSGNMDLLEKAFLNDEVQEQIQQLVRGKSIVSPIEKEISFSDFEQPEILFSLLLFSGYLSPMTKSSLQTDAYELAVPNREVQKVREFVKQLKELLLEGG